MTQKHNKENQVGTLKNIIRYLSIALALSAVIITTLSILLLTVLTAIAMQDIRQSRQQEVCEMWCPRE